MSPIDPSTLGTATPRALDGRTYPGHLRQYERLDADLLPLVAGLQPATFDDIAIAVADQRTRAVLPFWLMSAEWRGLLERVDTRGRAPRTWRLGPQGASHLPHAA